MRPNFLFIILDDLNAWIGALGRHPQVLTPHIDQLSRRGSLFVNAYCGAPYCNASRMGVFTGCLPSTLGVYHSEPYWDLPQRPSTFIEELRASGYHTVGSGKVFHGVFNYDEAGRARANLAHWKEVANRSDIWDQYRSLDVEPLPASRPQNGLFDFSNFDEVPKPYHLFDWGPLPDEGEPDLPDAKTVEFLARFLTNKPPEPFFCAAGLYKPHLPWHVPQRFFDRYPRDEVIVPLVKDDDLDDAPPIARKWVSKQPDHELVTSRGQWKDAVQAYLACISYADEQVGKLVTALDRAGLSERTNIVLCSDNGFHLGEKLHWRKFVLWEEATRVPLIAAGPSFPSGRRIEEPVSLIDIRPTILAAATVETHSRDGVDLAPLAASLSNERGRGVVMTWGRGNHSLRTRRWRYTRYSDSSRELFDHDVDPLEWVNLADRAEFQSVREGLDKQVSDQCGDDAATEHTAASQT